MVSNVRPAVRPAVRPTVAPTPPSRTELAIQSALADNKLTVAEARDLAATFETEQRDIALWPLVEVHQAIERGAVQAEPAAHATLRNLLIRERSSKGDHTLARRTLAALGAAGQDGAIDVDDAKKILAAARRDASPAAADKVIGEAFGAFTAGSTWLAKMDAPAVALFEAHFAARGLPYGENRASVERDVLRCLRYLKGRDTSAPPDTRVLHEMHLGRDDRAQTHTAFVDPEQRRTWLRQGDTWYGPISLDRGPEGKTLTITTLLQREERAWSAATPPGIEEHALTRWVVGGPNGGVYAYAALVRSEDATHAVVERRHKGSGRLEYGEVVF